MYTPDGIADFDAWVVRNVLERDSPLFREARHLLAEEPSLRDTGLYHSVLSAIAAGNTTRGGIASFLGRKSSDLAHPLTVLENSGLILREADAFRSGRSSYAISEPLVSFYHAIMRPEWSRLDRPGLAGRVWEQSGKRFLGTVVGPRFEAVCRDWCQFYASSETFGGPPTQVARGVVNDAAARRSHEVDVAVLGHADGQRRPLLAIGEAKWGETVGRGHLERLQRIRSVLEGHRTLNADGTRLLLFSGVGFTDELRSLADESSDISLIGLERLYGGE